MIVEYDPSADVLYIGLYDTSSAESEEAAQGLVPDFDAQDRVVGIEIETASKRVDLSRLELRSWSVSQTVTRGTVPA